MKNDPLPSVTIYSDGGCRPNPGPGGWGAVLLFPGKTPVELSGHENNTTNNRMELTAALEALRALDASHEVRLVTDSQYLKKGVTQWLSGWRTRGWKTASKQPVKNRDLWEALDNELSRHRVSWEWTRGHTGDRWNERADELASAAMGRPELPLDDPDAVHLFVAVAFSGKRGLGAWAARLRWRDQEKDVAGSVPGATANRMHIVSAIRALEMLRRPSRVHLYTVSSYLKDGATTWIRGWKTRRWRTRDGQSVRHAELWRRLDALVSRHDVTWHVVSDDDAPDELKMAKAAAREALRQ